MHQFNANNNIRLVPGGTAFFRELEQMIDNAKYSLHLQTYIFAHDETGTMIANALIRAAKRNVSVYVLADGYASQDLSEDLIVELEKAGVNFRFFEPLFSSKHLYFGRRLHHKVVVADGIRSLVGGMNIADRYNDMPGIKAWFDMALFTEGQVSVDLYNLCRRLWSKQRKALPSQAVDPRRLLEQAAPEGRYPVRMRRNDWVKRKQEIWGTYMELFRASKENITVMCSYFLPGAAFRKQIRKAAARGVRIKVILTGLSDIPVSKHAERYLYRWMLRNKIEIYEYQPSILHAKIAVSDGRLFTIGSYNMNNISAYASIELNLDVKHDGFCAGIQADLDKIIENDCKPVTEATYHTRLFSVRQLMQWMSFQLIRVTLTLTTFYFRQRE